MGNPELRDNQGKTVVMASKDRGGRQVPEEREEKLAHLDHKVPVQLSQ